MAKLVVGTMMRIDCAGIKYGVKKQFLSDVIQLNNEAEFKDFYYITVIKKREQYEHLCFSDISALLDIPYEQVVELYSQYKTIDRCFETEQEAREVIERLYSLQVAEKLSADI